VKEQGDNVAADKKLAVTEFADNYFCGPLYLDKELELYKLLGDRKISLCSLMANPIRTKRNWTTMSARAASKGVRDYNLNGEGLIKGGVVVVNSAGKVVYVYQEETFHQLPVADISAAIDSLLK